MGIDNMFQAFAVPSGLLGPAEPRRRVNIKSSYRPTVYLAGKMTGLTYEQCIGWRDDMTRLLYPDFNILSPMRGQKPETFANANVIAPCDSNFEMTRDLTDIERADIIVARFGMDESVSFGTCVELGTCIPLRRPVIFILDPSDRLRGHPFIKAFPRGITVDSLVDAASYLYSMFNL